jgi:hypothetical protein
LRSGFNEQKAVVDGFAACDFVARVRVDICLCCFLIGNASDVKLIAQSAIND